MVELSVYRLSFDTPVQVGTIVSHELDRIRFFSYDEKYIDSRGAIAISESLPLSKKRYTENEFRPYFEGLLPEYDARAILCQELQINENDYLTLLGVCGHDCIGDIVIREASELFENGDLSYQALTKQELKNIFKTNRSTVSENIVSRLSLAGTQVKTGLVHTNNMGLSQSGWLRPQGLAAASHIMKISELRDIPEIEYVCMKAAKACGLSVADVLLEDFGRQVLAVERFDRCVDQSNQAIKVIRLHQEDFAQAFGVTSASKYAELPGGTVTAIAEMIRRYTAQPAKEIRKFVQSLCFTYLIGDCDSHLKNYSLLWNIQSYRPVLSPSYDLVCTTRFERFSREMAFNFGSHRCIDAIDSSDFDQLAKDIGITPRMVKRIAESLVETVQSELINAGFGEYGQVFESTYAVAEDVADDCLPRLRVLEKFCTS